MKTNVKTLINWQKDEILDSTSQGKLKRLKKPLEKGFFWVKNFLFFGALKSRTQRSVYFTVVAFSLEINNPLNKKLFKKFFPRKMAFLRHLSNKIPFFKKEIFSHIKHYERASLLQQRIIDKALKVKLNKKGLGLEAQEALKKGIYPILITSGSSGAYWMRNCSKEVVGIFKPFDEDVYAPNNPLGPAFQGPFGTRRMRKGVLVGETMYREVAAYLVDQFFGFGLVPKTCFARFEHSLFYLSKEETSKTHKSMKQKIGSFQVCIEGFSPLYKMETGSYSISLEDIQLLIILDVIIGNLDRNTGNILVSGHEIAAIDHGLCFSDIPEELSFWYWPMLLDPRQRMHPAFLKLLQEFPFEELSQILKKKCYFSSSVLNRMRERVVLFRSGINQGLTIHQLERLMVPLHLEKLVDYDITLEERALNEVKSYIHL